MATRNDAKNLLKKVQLNSDNTAKLLSSIYHQVQQLTKTRELLAANAINPATLSSLTSSLEAMAELLAEETAQMALQYEKVTRYINAIPDAAVREVMIRHYYDGQCLNMIAYEKAYSESKAKYLHSSGLDYIARMM